MTSGNTWPEGLRGRETERPAAGSAAPAPRGRPTRKRNPLRARKLRAIIRYMIERRTLATGHQALLAAHFGLSRQRVNQLVALERQLLDRASAERERGRSESEPPMEGRGR